MKIVLDTSYFLFGYGIAPDNLPQDCLDKIEQPKEVKSIILSDYVIFEANAKASKLLPDCKGLNKKNRLIVTDPKYTVINSVNSDIWNVACFLRQFHKDYIDCIHWATAIIHGDVFLTQDTKIHDINSDTEFIEKFKSRFSHALIKIMNYQEFLNFILVSEKTTESSAPRMNHHHYGS